MENVSSPGPRDSGVPRDERIGANKRSGFDFNDIEDAGYDIRLERCFDLIRFGPRELFAKNSEFEGIENLQFTETGEDGGSFDVGELRYCPRRVIIMGI